MKNLTKNQFHLEAVKCINTLSELKLFDYILIKSFFNNDTQTFNEIDLKINEASEYLNLTRQSVSSSLSKLSDLKILIKRKAGNSQKVQLNNKTCKAQFTYSGKHVKHSLHKGKAQFTYNVKHSLHKGKAQFTYDSTQTLENTSNTANPIIIINKDINSISNKPTEQDKINIIEKACIKYGIAAGHFDTGRLKHKWQDIEWCIDNAELLRNNDWYEQDITRIGASFIKYLKGNSPEFIGKIQIEVDKQKNKQNKINQAKQIELNQKWQRIFADFGTDNDYFIQEVKENLKAVNNNKFAAQNIDKLKTRFSKSELIDKLGTELVSKLY